MHPKTKTQNTPSLTEKSKATTRPWFSRPLQHPATTQSGSILGHTHTLTYLLAPNPHGSHSLESRLPATVTV